MTDIEARVEELRVRFGLSEEAMASITRAVAYAVMQELLQETKEMKA